MQSLTSSLRILSLGGPAPARASLVRTLATAASTSAPPPSPDAPAEPARFTPRTRRTGVLARKHGMTALWAQDGSRIPVTVLEVRPSSPLPFCPLLTSTSDTPAARLDPGPLLSDLPRHDQHPRPPHRHRRHLAAQGKDDARSTSRPVPQGRRRAQDACRRVRRHRGCARAFWCVRLLACWTGRTDLMEECLSLVQEPPSRRRTLSRGSTSTCKLPRASSFPFPSVR